MQKNKGGNKPKKLEFLKELLENNCISSSEIKNLSAIDYPLFSFKYFDDKTIRDSKDYGFFIGFLSRLQKLSEIGWAGIRRSGRHGLGMESIPVKNIKKALPSIVTPEVKTVDVFRATGDNRVFVGLQQAKIFHVFFLEPSFGMIYNHK